jgi:hypothetical protein
MQQRLHHTALDDTAEQPRFPARASHALRPEPTDARGGTSMANHTESSGHQVPDRHRLSDEERDRRITTHSSHSRPTTNSPDDAENSGEMGPMHTNAGNTGFSSDQISPKTQNLPQTGPSASHPGRNKGSSNKNR